ncbi:MAG: DUF938 domain-containing protein [Myxococcales bacterium]|nr:DUF938 domain-containing protein [Myxococcales bacterium]MCB9530877.1 DUF938 domain-containing protein [Myxococcales bacterium]MCB9534333.1 DUF938 domain-containing protein [Myxococcales bacterium]
MAKLDYPASVRNGEAILAALQRLGVAGDVLEVACGSGQHAVRFASGLPGVRWLPTSRDPDERASVDAYVAEASLDNVLPAVALDVCVGPWPQGPFDAVFCANMIHIAPWEAALGLLAGAARVLSVDGVLVLYGPFAFGGRLEPESNRAFDASLRSRDPLWGVRDLGEVEVAAAAVGLRLDAVEAMPANNHLVTFRRASK